VWLIVGLGNPGLEYADTPHNLGFAVVDRLTEQARIRAQQERGRSVIARGRLDAQEVLLAKPLTYMNRSGPAVEALLRSEGATPADLVVILDEVALPWGMIRVRERGSAGGHKGLESVVAAVGTTEFLRVRLGVQPPAGWQGDLAEYVTMPMSPEQQQAAGEMTAEAAEAVRLILREGPARAMARFNRRVDEPQPSP
jgi:PTH1 family peptidyl-tRNA hydrolase